MPTAAAQTPAISTMSDHSIAAPRRLCTPSRAVRSLRRNSQCFGELDLEVVGVVGQCADFHSLELDRELWWPGRIGGAAHRRKSNRCVVTTTARRAKRRHS